MNYKKKLIEVALPLEAINKEAAREKSIRHGHPSTLHLWWARRPLAACKAVLFASLVDDPSSNPDKFPTEEAQAKERERLFKIIEELVKWENINNENVFNKAKQEILKSTDGNPPPVLDPFCGGGSIPLEAQRLGLKAYASDLNPVAVMITKAMIEIPPKFAGMPPINPKSDKKLRTWKGAQGLAEDVRYYGQWMRTEAEKKIGHLYPKVKLPKEYGGGEATVIAWLWARTVKCPNPACGAQMPLVTTFSLSTKKKNKAYVQPVVDDKKKIVNFVVKMNNGEPPKPPKLGKGAKFRCIVCEQVADEKSLRKEFIEKRISQQLMAIVAEADKGRLYLSPDSYHDEISKKAVSKWKPEEAMNTETPNLVSGRGYGVTHWHEIFTPRQLVALTTFSDLIKEARDKVLNDAKASGMKDDGLGINNCGKGAIAYADSIATYLAFAVDRCADAGSTIATWSSGGEFIRFAFARQALAMTWDYAECNLLSNATGNFLGAIEWIVKVIDRMSDTTDGKVKQLDATSAINGMKAPLISTDPPYYDNIAYADLSDYFYIWMRRNLNQIYPDIFSTVLVPKSQELVATPYRFKGNKDKAARFFEEGLGKAFERMKEVNHSDYPLTVYYAFKQSEEDESKDGDNIAMITSTGWETMLEGLLKAGFAINGTWPMRSERGARSIAIGTNALASSIVLVCRAKSEKSEITSRKDFISELKRELPLALRNLQQGNIAPVDLAQASIGPGMAIYSKYSKVIEADGRPMTVRMALALINQTLDEVLSEQEGDLEPDTRWALDWFKQYGMNEGPFGEAETLARAKNVAVQGLVEAGIIFAKGGKVRLLNREELDPNWDPVTDKRATIWEFVQHLVRVLDKEGLDRAAVLVGKIGAISESSKLLAYQLYNICERKKWTQEALAFNSLITAWPDLIKRSKKVTKEAKQSEMGPLFNQRS